MLSSSCVVEENDLFILITLDLASVGAIARDLREGINVDDLPVSSVTEHETLLVNGINPEVLRRLELGLLGVPVHVRQVVLVGNQRLPTFKIWLEVISLESVGEVDVATDVDVTLLVSDEDDGGQSTRANLIFSQGQSAEESGVLVVGIGATKSFSLFFVSQLNG